jgi:hypothetical protein
MLQAATSSSENPLNQRYFKQHISSKIAHRLGGVCGAKASAADKGDPIHGGYQPPQLGKIFI